jgi:signal transduction histidine kinase
MRFGLTMCGAVVLAVAVTVTVTVRRATPLYRVVRRAAMAGNEEVPPPSEAATRDAFALPRWVVGSVVAAVLGVLGFDAVAAAPLSELHPVARRIGLHAWIAAFVLASTVPIELACRRLCWSWLGRVRPSELTVPTRRSVRRCEAIRAAMGVAVVGLGAWALLAARTAGIGPSEPGLSTGLVLSVGAVGGFVAVALAGWIGGRVGALATEDFRAITAEVQYLTEVRHPEPRAGVARAPRTRSGVELASAIETLAARYAQASNEEEQARAAIERAQRLKSRFMAFMSHDLRSPLNSIRGFAEVLARGNDGPLRQEQLESVDMIRESGHELLRLVDDILDSAKLEAGRLELRREWTPAVEILTEVVRESGWLVHNKPIHLETQIEPGLPPVYVDRARIVQAVLGVLGHVVRVMQQGTILLRAQVHRGPPGPERHLRMEVVAPSANIRPEDRELLFEAFRALREPSGRRIGGLGLGLSLARSLATGHGGDLWQETRREQETTFCVALPLTAVEL